MKQQRPIRTRYAPSPTGQFHIGGARTALFNYLFARKNNGKFIVRIEDTDIERNVEGGIESQLNNLEWMKIKPDESIRVPGSNEYGPYVQSQKIRRYKELAESLLLDGKAYRCFCTKEELADSRDQAKENHVTPKYNRRCESLTKEEIQTKLDEGVPYVIRLRIEDDKSIEWDDIIRGKMCVPTSALTDPVILKSNGYPMYNFAVVVDDYDMDITHVLRGEEHISNTPYQIAIKKALNFDVRDIKYGHLSIIIDETGKKLSKRNKELKQFIDDYRTIGFAPEAVDNFLMLLGWSPADNKEFIQLHEAEQIFDIERVSKAPAFFDYKKMLWISNQYFKNMPEGKYLSFVGNFVTFHPNIFGDKFNDVLMLFKNQISYATEINDLVRDSFLTTKFDSLTMQQISFLKTDESLKNIQTFEELVNNLPSNNISVDDATKLIDDIKNQTGLSGKNLFMPIRMTLIAKEHGPELNKTISIIGKQKILQNIEEIKKMIA